MRDSTIDRTPEQFAELMSPVCKTLTEISERARSFGLARSYGDDASISYYPRREQPWIAYQWIHGTKALKGRGGTPMEAVAALAEQIDACDPALNWETLGVEKAP